MTYENILFDVTDGIATITMNRNDTRNALSWAMADDISDALDRLGGARVLVITGAGKGFCSGGDLASTIPEGLDRGQMLQNGLMQSVNPMLAKIDALDIPVIAAVNGAAAGAGAPFALAADLVIAAESAFFLMAFANVGLVPDAGGSWILSRLIGKARAMQMILLAERISAVQAQQWGMIYKVVPDDQLAGETATLARKLANGPTLAYGLARKALLASLECDLDSALANEAAGQRIAGASKDCDEAIAAFMAKRAPVFSGE
jgi:2-(1,2-epoxy-1,2-dihydrophenyl)acetyl-CoA isomerase